MEKDRITGIICKDTTIWLNGICFLSYLLFQIPHQSTLQFYLNLSFCQLFIRPPSMCTCFIGFFVFAAFLVDMIVLKTNMTIKMYYEPKVCIVNAILRQLPLPVGGACKKPRKTELIVFELEYSCIMWL